MIQTEYIEEVGGFEVVDVLNWIEEVGGSKYSGEFKIYVRMEYTI